MEGVPRAKIAAWEPWLVSAPALAAWAPDHFAVEPADLALQLTAAAGVMRAKVYWKLADAIETAGGRVVGIRVRGETIPADIADLANSYGARSLAASLGSQLLLLEAPAVLRAASGLIRHLLCGSGLEFRRTFGRGLTAAAECPQAGEDRFEALALPVAPLLLSLLPTTDG